MQISQLQGKKIAILGFGLEGQSTLKFLLGHHIKPEDISILDQNDIERSDLPADLATIVTWEQYLDGLGAYDLIFKSPGISPYHAKIARQKAKLTSQVEVFFANYEWKVIWVTATKGKSTTVTLLYKTLIQAWLDVKLVWNIGTPVLDEIDLSANHDYIVYELSSFMLEGFKPKLEIGVLWNIFRCHLDWHNEDYDVYRQAKVNILEHAKHRLINIDLVSQFKIPHLRYFGTDGDYMYQNKNFLIHGQSVLKDENILLKWEHNRINIASVIGVLDVIADWNREDLIAALQHVLAEFSGLPHRLQEVGTYQGITCVNDSISTTPESTIQAIKTYMWKTGTLLLGGHNYGFEFEELAKAVAQSGIKNIVFFPDTGRDIKRAIDATWYEYNSLQTDSMKDAVTFAYKHTSSWQIMLLSCASPSFSMYDNYKQRGDDFANQVKMIWNS